MAKEKDIGDIFWIVLIWLLAGALVFVALVKFKIFFHS